MMERTPPAIEELLTPREREVLAFLRLELTNEQIAARMEISADGVKYHVSEIIGKLGVRNRREAARWPAGQREPAVGAAPAAAFWQQAGGLLPFKPSTAALALTGTIVVVAVAGIGLVMLLLFGPNGDEADGGESVSIGAPNAVQSSDPRAIVEQALTAMDELDSYSAAYRIPTRTEDLRVSVAWEIEFKAPDSYRILLFGAEGESEQRCKPPLSPDGIPSSGRTCYDILTNITAYTVDEMVFVGEATYTRQCNETDGVCDPWSEQPRGPFVIAGPSPTFLPGWELVALELADGLEFVGEDDVEGATLIHLRGSVNHMRAIFENQRRVLTEAGVTSFGSECTRAATLPSEPPAEENCRELTFEESLEQQEPDLSFYDGHPATIDVWVSRNDALLQRIELDIPANEPAGLEDSFTIKYSLFNEVEIEAP